jgi:hypothetical protein
MALTYHEHPIQAGGWYHLKKSKKSFRFPQKSTKPYEECHSTSEPCFFSLVEHRLGNFLCRLGCEVMSMKLKLTITFLLISSATWTKKKLPRRHSIPLINLYHVVTILPTLVRQIFADFAFSVYIQHEVVPRSSQE